MNKPGSLSRKQQHLIGGLFVAFPLAFLPSVGFVSFACAQDMHDETIEQGKDATVMVWTLASKRQKADTPLGTGTGYFINSTGLLITNNHVVDPAHGLSPAERQKFQYQTNRLSYKIIQNSGTKNEKIWDCDLIHQSVTADQALLQARNKDGDLLPTPNYLHLQPAWRLHKDLTVCALGFPGGNSLAERGHNAAVFTSIGKITNVPRSTSGRIRRIETDAIARPGNSGGPMIDAEGNVVGTVTLLSQAEDQANQCALVPSSLTRSFIREAINDGRIPDGADVVPFLDIFARAGERIELPSLKRMPDRDTIFMGNDERVYGTFGGEDISWASPLGQFHLPIETLAYIMRYGDRVYAVLENGDYLVADDTGGMFQFAADGGANLNKSFANISVVAFRLHATDSKRLHGDVAVLSSSAGHLLLTDVQGQATLESESGTIKVSLPELIRIESDRKRDRQVVYFADERVITGRLGNQKFHAKIGGLGQSIDLELSHVNNAAIELLDASSFNSEGVTLLEILRSADPELIRVARQLDDEQLDAATKTLAPFLDKERMKHMPDVLKSRVRLLDGIIALRAGKSDADRTIRKCVKAKDPNVAAYARGCVEVLRRYGDKFDGKPLSDPDTFAKAGLALGNELIHDARALLKDREHLEGKRGEYTKYINKIKKSEKAMMAASVFAGPEADDVLMNLWKMTLDLCRLESQRLIEEYDTIRAGRTRVSTLDYRKLDTIRKNYMKVIDEWRERYINLREYGFYQAAEPEDRKFDN